MSLEVSPQDKTADFQEERLEQCARCGAVSVRWIGGIWLCDIEKGGCNRPTSPASGKTNYDPAYEREVSPNGTGPLATYTMEHPEAMLDGYTATDIGNSRRLIDHHGKNIRYVSEFGWLVWTGTRWHKDRTDLLMRYAKDTVRGMIHSAGESLALFRGDPEHKEDLRKAKDLIKHAETTSSSRKLKSMVELSQSEPEIVEVPESFDSNPLYFNCINGTVDLANGEAHVHEPADRITRLCPTEYKPEAECPKWLAFLKSVFQDDQLINYIQRVVGYCLTGSGKEQVVFIHHGSGSNGKSTFLNTIMKVIGEEYAAQIDASSITDNKRGGANNDIARLRGKRFVSSIEVGEGRKLNEVLVKQFTGEDKIAARFLFKEFFEFQAEFKLHIAANHKPEVKGQDNAMWRRVRLIPYKKTFTDKDKDPELPAKLLAEKAGILAWAIRGALEWQKTGLVTPEVVQEATLAYRSEMNELADFLSVWTFVYPGASCVASGLFGRYREVCEAVGEKPMSQTAFGRRLHDLGYQSGKDGGVRVWHGLSLEPKPNTLDKIEHYRTD